MIVRSARRCFHITLPKHHPNITPRRRAVHPYLNTTLPAALSLVLISVIPLIFVGSAVDRIYGSPEDPGMFLIELLETYPHYLGDQEDIGDLPFMFKVLSINKALSIQARTSQQPFDFCFAVAGAHIQ